MRREPKTGPEIDEVILAEYPQNDPELLQLVEKHMRHKHYRERCFRTAHQKSTQRYAQIILLYLNVSKFALT